MDLYNLINTNELKQLYESWNNTTINFSTYYNNLDINKFNVKAKQYEYLFNGEIKFSNRTSTKKYTASLVDVYDYSRVDVDNDNVYIQSTTDGGIIATLPEEVVNLQENVVSTYPFLWYEVINGSEIIFSVPNQGNWNINSFINDNGELILNTDNE